MTDDLPVWLAASPMTTTSTGGSQSGYNDGDIPVGLRVDGTLNL